MTNLKRSFFGAAVYLAVIFVLGQAGYAGRPLMNFANYFYLAVIVAMPLTLFFPRISRISVYVPLLFWAVVYIKKYETQKNHIKRIDYFTSSIQYGFL